MVHSDTSRRGGERPADELGPVAQRAGRVPRIGIVGTGRAGRSFARALSEVGWSVRELPHAQVNRTNLDSLAERMDIVLLCVPDSVIAEIAGLFGPDVLDDHVVLAHCSGASDLGVLAPASRRGSVHPLVSLSGDEPRELSGAWYALAGDPALGDLVDALDGSTISVPDERRHLYHAGAVIASNHLVALMAQVEVIAQQLGVPFEAFMDLARGSLENTARLGPATALTGPVSRGDWETVRGHLRVLPEAEVGAYLALAKRAAVLAGRDPAEIEGPREP